MTPPAGSSDERARPAASAEGLVTVVLPCYDCEAFLGETLASLLAQSHRELEILAIDDGSSDGTRGVLERFAAGDSRVRVLVNRRNRGLIETLNRGLAAAGGQYLARMDADDIAPPQRIRRQVAFLRANPDVDVVGGGVDLIDERGRPAGRRPARCTAPEAVRLMTFLGTPLEHPTLLGRTAVLQRFPYRALPHTLHAEDYDLFARMSSEGIRLANLDEPLLEKRVFAGSVSRRFEDVQIASFVACAREHLARELGLQPEGGPVRVLVNRIDGSIDGKALRGGLRLLDEVARRVVGPDLVGVARDEALAVVEQQRADILIQAARRGAPSARIGALALAFGHAPGFFSPRVRRYLATKLDLDRRRRP